MMLIAVSATAVERITVPAPPGGGPGVNTAPRDLAGPVLPYVPLPETGPMPNLLDEGVQDAPAEGEDVRSGDIGGDDVFVIDEETILDTSMDIAANGDIYSASEVWGTTGYEIHVYRSTDGGTLWDLWAAISDASSSVHLMEPYLRIAEGNDDRCLIAYRRYLGSAGDDEIHVTWSDLGLTNGAFVNDVTALASAGVDYEAPRFATDAETFTGYYIYLVAVGDAGAGGDIWFARSTDMGSSFETGYAIAALTATDREYVWPDVSYGFGHFVHVSWHFHSLTDSFEDAVRYRRAESYANDGLADWAPIQYLTNINTGMYENYTRIHASINTNDVAIAHHRREPTGSGGFFVRDPGILTSSDNGYVWSADMVIPSSFSNLYGFERDRTTGRWLLGGFRYSRPHLQRTTATDPAVWDPIQSLGDRSYHTGSGLVNGGGVAMDASRGNRAGVFWNQYWSSQQDSLRFDAEWREDPGYPNHAEGFPLDLTGNALSEPALVDVDGNGTKEIVFTDDDDRIQVIQHDGTNLPGWPVTVPVVLSLAPVAVGDLNLDGEMTVVVGTDNGQIYAYEPDGTLVSGFPYTMPDSDPVYVSIGDWWAPDPRSIIAVAGVRLRVFNSSGNHIGWTMSDGPPSGPAAIGDVDNDGFSEIVCAFGTQLRYYDRQSNSSPLITTLPSAPSEAVTLGDVDLDGDVEIACPMPDGTLHLYRSNGTEMPGWPYTSTSGALSAAAFADNLWNSAPEIAVASNNWTAHLLYADGSVQGGYPVNNDGWRIYGSPVMGFLADSYSSDLILGSRGDKAWAWDNFGHVVEGWPKPLPVSIYLTAAIDDIDLDGTTEVVMLHSDQLIVLDVNQVVGDENERWPMYAHDARRTGCSDCPEGALASADEGGGAFTRVSFAAPWPNPVSDDAVFSFTTPVRARMELKLFDLKGRQVRTLSRAEVPSGPHVVQWDGCDDDGRQVASGHYLATLKLDGPGVKQALTRKVVVVR